MTQIGFPSDSPLGRTRTGPRQGAAASNILGNSDSEEHIVLEYTSYRCIFWTVKPAKVEYGSSAKRNWKKDGGGGADGGPFRGGIPHHVHRYGGEFDGTNNSSSSAGWPKRKTLSMQYSQ